MPGSLGGLPRGARQTFASQPTGNVSASTSAWVDLCSVVLPPGKFDIQGYTNFICTTTAGWIAIRIANAAATVVYGGNAVYMTQNAAHEMCVACGAALVPGGQVVKLQGWTDVPGGNSPQFGLYSGWGASFGVATQIIARMTT